MVMPIYDDNPFKLPHRPLMTWGLILVNIGVFFAEFSAASGAQAVVNDYGLTPAAFTGEIKAVGSFSPVTTVFTSMFLHADIMHLLALGRLRFLLFYLLCGAIGALVFVATDAHGRGPLIGASGAISGIIIAYVMLRPCAKVTVLISIIPLRISAYWVVGAFAFMQFINLESAAKSDVAYWCHIGGMAAGGVLFPLMRPAGVKLFECIRGPKAPAVAAGIDRGGAPGG